MTVKLAIGVPGSGKTLALQDMASDACVDGWTCFVVDRPGEWSADMDGAPNPRWRGDAPLIVEAPHPPDDESEAEALLSWLGEQRDAGGRVVRFGYPWEAWDVAQLAVDTGDVVFIDDEIDELASYSGWKENPLRLIIHRGRHLPDAQGVTRELHCYGAARRPQSLHTDLFTLADEVFCFRVQGDSTLQRLTREGVLSESMAVEATQLPNFEFFRWRSDGSRQRGRLVEPEW